MRLKFDKIQDQLVSLVPGIAPAAERYWEDEGHPGEDSGAYIFFAFVFNVYVEILLHLPPAPSSDRMLSNVFHALELMLTADSDVRDLGYTELLHGRGTWWLKHSEPFLGPAAQSELDRWRPEWRNEIENWNSNLKPELELSDIYNIRGDIEKELGLAT